MLTLKACLHLHVQGDPIENIKYSHRELFEYAFKNGFEVLAIYISQQIYLDPRIQFAGKEFGITVIPGIEQTIQKRHVLILNANIEAEQIKNFNELAAYKQKFPECCVIAPHPYHLLPNCLGQDLEQNIELFDAIEWNYFYSELINPNKKSLKIAQKYNKPLVSTSDVHILKHINHCYTNIHSKSKSVNDILLAIKNNQIETRNKPFKTYQLLTTLLEIYKATR